MSRKIGCDTMRHAMDISYLGHSCFRLKGKEATVITDPFDAKVGFSLPKLSADIVTISHDHSDHNKPGAISGTARREKPFVIEHPGEYEISGVSVFGIRTFHDASEGSERGENTVFLIQIDGVRVAHLGDLGHPLSERQVEEIGESDVLFLPVGGVYTLDPKEAVEVISQLEPSIVIPMHYKTSRHEEKAFGKLASVDEFLVEGGFQQSKKEDKLSLTRGQMPEEMEVVVLKV